MADLMVRVCDECKSQSGVKRYEVREGSRKARMDLCGDHSGSLEEVLGKAPSLSKAVRATRSRARKATSMEEIEALKKS